MFGFGKKKKTNVSKNKKLLKQKKKSSKSNVSSQDKYKSALENVVGKNGVDPDELEALTSGLDDDLLLSEASAPVDDDLDLDLEDDGNLSLDEDNGNDFSQDVEDDDLERVSNEDLDEDDPLRVLKQKPVPVTDDESERKRKLQEADIDDMSSEDFDGFSTDDALTLLQDVDEDEEMDEDDISDSDGDYEDSVPDDLIEDDEDDPTEEEDDTDEEDDYLDDDDTPLNEPEPEEQGVMDVAPQTPSADTSPRQITREEAFNALTPVQQTILRQMDKIDSNALKTQAEMVEENLYMQSQIIEWSNAYSAQMKHLVEWQEYADKLRDILVKQDSDFQAEREHQAKRHQIQLRNVRASLEADYAEREDKVLHDQRIAKDMVEEASRLLNQAREHGSEDKATIKILQDQIRALTTRPAVSTSGPVPIAPAGTSADIFKDLGLRKQLSNQTSRDEAFSELMHTADNSTSKTDDSTVDDSDEIDDLFDEDNW